MIELMGEVQDSSCYKKKKKKEQKLEREEKIEKQQEMRFLLASSPSVIASPLL